MSAGMSALMSLSQPAWANSGNQMSSTSMMSKGDLPAAMPGRDLVVERVVGDVLGHDLMFGLSAVNSAMTAFISSGVMPAWAMPIMLSVIVFVLRECAAAAAGDHRQREAAREQRPHVS